MEKRKNGAKKVVRRKKIASSGIQTNILANRLRKRASRSRRRSNETNGDAFFEALHNEQLISNISTIVLSEDSNSRSDTGNVIEMTSASTNEYCRGPMAVPNISTIALSEDSSSRNDTGNVIELTSASTNNENGRSPMSESTSANVNFFLPGSTPISTRSIESFNKFEEIVLKKIDELLVRMSQIEKYTAKTDARLRTLSDNIVLPRPNSRVATNIGSVDQIELTKRGLPIDSLDGLNSLEENLKKGDFLKDIVSKKYLS